MLKKTMLVLSFATFVARPIAAIAVAKQAVEPTGAARKKQYENVLKDCRKKYGGASSRLFAVWESHYGRSGWWCLHG
jgi:membrane-bound lytic murein transglycosylase B